MAREFDAEFDAEFARMTPEEQKAYVELLRLFAERKLRQMGKGERQMKLAAVFGVKLTDFSNPN